MPSVLGARGSQPAGSMASPNDLSQTSGATQPAVCTQPAIAFAAAANPLGACVISTDSSANFMQPMHKADGYLKLYFSELCGDVHGPLHFAPDERVEQIQQWLEEETFRSRCVDEDKLEWLAHVEISTSCGKDLDHCRTLDEYLSLIHI